MIGAVVVVIVAVAQLAGCGGDDGADVSDVAEADVVEAMDLRPEGSGEYVTADGNCRVYQIIVGEDEVGVYEAAGGNIATNEDGTVAARVNPESPAVSDADCVETIQGQLDEAF